MPRPDQRPYTRAYHRSLARLRDLYPDVFAEIYAGELDAALLERELELVGHEDLLRRPGPRTRLGVTTRDERPAASAPVPRTFVPRRAAS